MINAIAIDDEPKAISVIAAHISKIEGIKLVHQLYDPKKALVFLRENPVDLIFLDINMPHLSGLEMLQKLQLKPMLIFTTAYTEFALESYEHHAVDYLLKPFEFERFKMAIDKAKAQFKTQNQEQTFFFIKDGFATLRIQFNDILFIKGSGNYLDIVTKTKTYSPRMTFSGILDKLPSNLFIRVHQSYLVNVERIDKIEDNHIYLGSNQIPISHKFKEQFLKRLNLA
jgi:DNA-binding LytR/AlgR family response regulator